MRGREGVKKNDKKIEGECVKRQRNVCQRKRQHEERKGEIKI